MQFVETVKGEQEVSVCVGVFCGIVCVHVCCTVHCIQLHTVFTPAYHIFLVSACESAERTRVIRCV